MRQNFGAYFLIPVVKCTQSQMHTACDGAPCIPRLPHSVLCFRIITMSVRAVLWASHLYIYAYATPLLTRITIMFNGRCCHRIIIIIVYFVVDVVWSRCQQLIRNSVRKSYYILSSMVATKQELHQYFSERNVSTQFGYGIFSQT